MSRARKKARSSTGSGTVEHRGNAWFVRRSEGVGEQRRRWRDGPFHTKEEAIAHRDKGKRLRGTPATICSVWLLDWVERTKVELYAEEREADANIKHRHVRLHLAPNLDRIRIGDLRVGDLNHLWRKLNDEGLSRKTINNVKSTLSVALADAVADGLLNVNPVRDSRLPRQHRGTADQSPAPDALEKVLEDDDLLRFLRWCLDNVYQSTWALPLLVIADTGMRRGVGQGTLSESIDFQAGTLKIERQVVQLDAGKLAVRLLKTKASRRAIPLAPRTLAALQAYRRRLPVHPISGLVFTNADGRALIPDSLTQFVEKVLVSQLDLPKSFSPHALRHTHASVLLAADIPVADVSKRLGHSNPFVTLSIYSRGTIAGGTRAATKWQDLTGDAADG